MYQTLWEIPLVHKGLSNKCLLYSDHEIDEIEWSPDGSVIIVGVSAGILYVIEAKSMEIVFSMVS